MSDIVEIQQFNKIYDMLKDIKTVNGYQTTIKQVNKCDVSYEQMNGIFPTVNIIVGDLVYDRFEAGRHIKKRQYILDTYYRANNHQEAQEMGLKLVADFEIRFNERTLNGNSDYRQSATAFNLENKCLTVEPAAVTIWDITESTDIYNIGWEMLVHFRQNANDPTQLY